jgi:hypothetical protein
MCWFLKRKTATPAPKAEKNNRSHADEIRKYVRTSFITPARMKGQSHVSFSAEEIQAKMGQGTRLQSIVSAVDAEKFPGFARAKLTRRTA